MKLPVVTHIENSKPKPLGRLSVDTNLFFQVVGDFSQKKERLCKTDLTGFQRKTHGLKYSLLQRQIRQINQICGGVKDIPVIKVNTSEIQAKKTKLPSEVYDAYRLEHNKGAQWTSYRDMAGVIVHITHASEFTAPPPPAQPHKPINRFQTTAAVYKLCQEIERADFTGKTDDIIDLCAAFDAMKI